MSAVYGLMPWHIDGPEALSYDEIEAYLEHLVRLRAEGEAQ